MGRPRLGEWISGVSAILLFVLMFRDWFGTKNDGELQLFSVGRTAWEALDYIPVVLVATVVASLAVIVLRLAKTDLELPSPVSVVVAVFGVVSVLLIGFRIVDPPNFGSLQELWGTFTIEGTAQTPIFLALLAALGVALGGFVAMRDEYIRGRAMD